MNDNRESAGRDGLQQQGGDQQRPQPGQQNQQGRRPDPDAPDGQNDIQDGGVGQGEDLSPGRTDDGGVER